MVNNNKEAQPQFLAWRFYFILALVFLAVCGLLWRVYHLTILDQTFLRKQGDQRVLRLMSTPSYRGMIMDRNGFPLAVSTSVYSAWINPQEFHPSKTIVSAISKILEMKPSEIHTLLKRYQKSNKEFVYLKRAFAPDVAAQLKALGVTGLYTQEEYKRYYPEGEIAAQVIGFTNVDDEGQEGLELAYNHVLKGESGKKWVIKDRLGRIISHVQTVQDEKPGHDLMLSIDRRIQYLAYRELMAGVIENKASYGSAIVLDTQTGEVLAMANYPSFNPNNRQAQSLDVLRNKAMTDTFEPGSTIKAFSVASALDSGQFKPLTLIDTHPGWLRVGRNIVKDEHDNGPITVTRILQISSNVGVTKMVLSLPPDTLWNLLHRVGFGEQSGALFPGEQSGSLVRHHPWGAFVLATLGFGYGISVTPLQLTRAYSVIAASGVKLPISLVKVDKAPTGERVMDEKIAKQMLGLLEAVVTKGGTGELANVPGYRVAGKTGTAKMAGAHGYQSHRYTSTFVGIAPATKPRLVVSVVIHNPQGKHYHGGTVSGPVFEHIMEGALRILDVAPDAVT